MAQSLDAWIATDVARARQRSLRNLSEEYFFRDPIRPIYADSGFFFAPADGVLLYQRRVSHGAPLIEIKGQPYTLNDALRGDLIAGDALVIGIFMTLYDVHINRVPYAGTLHYTALPPIETHNRPMLEIEEALLDRRTDIRDAADYLFVNQRMLNRVFAPTLGLTYYILQIADYDVASIEPFEQRQARWFGQNQRFSQIRFGSQVDLIIPLSPDWRFETLLPDATHVEAGIDPLLRVFPASERSVP